MILTLNYAAKTYEQLRNITRPKSGTQPESLPWVMFDTQAYPSAGIARLVYYGSTAASLGDLTLSNFPTGTLEQDQFFEIQRVFLSFLAPLSLTTTAAVAGSANDVDLLHKTARGVLTLQLLGKPIGPFPADFFGRPGGVQFQGTSEGTETAPGRNIIQSAETVMNGGFPMVGASILQPTTPVKWLFDFNATAISAQMNIRHAMLGVFHRRVA